MKFIQIFIPVAILHVVVIAVLLLQPGCQSRTTPPPVPPGSNSAAATAQQTSPFLPGSTPTATTPPPAAPTARFAPTRPVGADTSSSLPADFNAGMSFEDGGEAGLLRPFTEDDSAPVQTYTVAAGDTLSGIARRHGVSVADLRAANSLSGDTIFVGNTLTIPAPSAGGSGPVVATSIDSAGGATYTVKAGDNLSTIARRHGLTVAELKANNGLTSDRINVGQTLYVPGQVSSSTPPPSAPSSAPRLTNDGSTYEVKAGDTLGGIGKRLGVDYREIMRANGISDPTRLRVGQVLIVPGAAPRTASTVVPPVTNPRPTPAASATPATPTPQPAPPLYAPPTRPAVIDGGSPGNQPINPDDLEAMLDDLPVSESEVVEPTGGGE